MFCRFPIANSSIGRPAERGLGIQIHVPSCSSGCVPFCRAFSELWRSLKESLLCSAKLLFTLFLFSCDGSDILIQSKFFGFVAIYQHVSILLIICPCPITVVCPMNIDPVHSPWFISGGVWRNIPKAGHKVSIYNNFRCSSRFYQRVAPGKGKKEGEGWAQSNRSIGGIFVRSFFWEVSRI